MNKLITTLLLVLTCAGLAYSGIVSRPTKTTGGTSYTDGTVPHASDFNGDFDTIYVDYNGNITNANIAPGAAIAASKILTDFTTNLQVATAAVPCFVNIDTSLGADLKQWRLCQNGGTLSIAAYTDAGAAIITPLSIARATGIITTAGGIVISSGNLSLTSGTITVTALTAKSFLFSGVGGLLSTTTAPTNGQLLIGNTGNSPSVSSLAGTATHVCVTNGAGTITLDLCANPAITAPVFSGTPTGSLTNLALTTPAVTSGVLTTSTVAADPTVALGVASKQYADADHGTGQQYNSTSSLGAGVRYAELNGASFTNTLPAVATSASRLVTFIHRGTSLTNVYTIKGNGADTIEDGTNTYLLYTNNERVTLFCTGASWIVLDHVAETDWVDAGPMTILGSTSNPTKASSPDYDHVFWRRSGREAYVKWVLQFSSASGAANGSGAYLFETPTGITIDAILPPVATPFSTNVMSEGLRSGVFGRGQAVEDGVALDVLTPYAYDTTHIQWARTSTAQPVGSATFALTTTEFGYYLEAHFPAANWRQ